MAALLKENIAWVSIVITMAVLAAVWVINRWVGRWTDAADSVTLAQETVEEAVEEIIEETGGPKGLEPTRYGDWERKGRAIDF